MAPGFDAPYESEIVVNANETRRDYKMNRVNIAFHYWRVG